MYYSMKTTNKSFINMWRFLQRNYVENNLFMLQTHNQDLVDFSIDKYRSMDRDDPSFKDYRDKVIQEAKDNLWFYFRELAVIPDPSSITGYKQFELTPQSMMMIYLYIKKCSFINLTTDNDICLAYLWNHTKSLYNNDLIMTNDIESAMEISKNTKKCIANMPLQIPFGSTQAISDSIDHFIICNNDAFQNFYLKNKYTKFVDYVVDKGEKYLTDNQWVDEPVNIFILEDNLPLLAYTHILELNYGERLYLNAMCDNMTADKVILNKFLKMLYPIADTSIYDSKTLESRYLI